MYCISNIWNAVKHNAIKTNDNIIYNSLFEHLILPHSAFFKNFKQSRKTECNGNSIK